MYAVSSTVTVKAYFHFHTEAVAPKSFVRNLRFCFELEIDSTYSGNIFFYLYAYESISKLLDSVDTCRNT